MNPFRVFSKRKLALIASACMLSASSVFAEAGEDLDLSALLNLTSSVASKIEQPIQDAPGIVTVYTKDDIKRFGYNTLAELADITPGYSTNIRFGEKGFETRGQGLDGWNNNKHLLLVDGIPVRHVRANRAMIEENMPIHNAARVEFLKGPASALYGVGAFFGVINVTTDEPAEEGVSSQTRILAGNEDATMGAFGSVSGKTDKGVSKAAASYYERQASLIPIEGSNKRLYQDDNQSIFVSASHKMTDTWAQGLALGFLYSQKTGGIGEYWGATTADQNLIRWTTFLPYIKYNRDLTDKFTLNSYVSITQSSENGIWSGDPYNEAVGTSDGPSVGEWNDVVRSVDAVLEGNISINDDHGIIAGFNFYTNKGLGDNNGTMSWNLGADANINPIWGGDAAFELEKDPSNTVSGYLQYNGTFPVLEGLMVTAGLREDVGIYKESNFNQLSPRLALVQKISPFVNAKVLIGTALRAPGQKEFNLNDETNRRLAEEGQSIRVPDIGAETIKSFEGGVTFNNDHVSSSVSGFYNITQDIIEAYVPYSATDGDLNAFRNGSGEIKAYGLEIDNVIAVNKDLRFLLNYAWAATEDLDGLQFEGIPTHKLNIGASYTTPGPVPTTLTLLNKYVAGYNKREGGVEVDDYPGINTMDMMLSVAVTENLSLDLQGKNLFDEDQTVLSGGGAQVPTESRRFFGGVTARF